jgi:hypothetical protein
MVSKGSTSRPCGINLGLSHPTVVAPGAKSCAGHSRSRVRTNENGFSFLAGAGPGNFAAGQALTWALSFFWNVHYCPRRFEGLAALGFSGRVSD